MKSSAAAAVVFALVFLLVWILWGYAIENDEHRRKK